MNTLERLEELLSQKDAEIKELRLTAAAATRMAMPGDQRSPNVGVCRPEHTPCKCQSRSHYLTVTNESRCLSADCEERFVCARCIIDQRDWMENTLLTEREAAAVARSNQAMANKNAPSYVERARALASQLVTDKPHLHWKQAEHYAVAQATTAINQALQEVEREAVEWCANIADEDQQASEKTAQHMQATHDSGYHLEKSRAKGARKIAERIRNRLMIAKVIP